jgi:hypothetical protein
VQAVVSEEVQSRLELAAQVGPQACLDAVECLLRRRSRQHGW